MKLQRLLGALVVLTCNCFALLAVEFGWQQLPDGGLEYLVQVEPELIESFREQGYTSELPSGLRDIRRIRVVVGSAPLPNQGDLAGPPPSQDKADGAETPQLPAEEQPRVQVSAADTKDDAVEPASYTAVDAAKPVTNEAGPLAPVLPESRLRGPLVMTALGLFLSIGANVYLVWIHQEARLRYRRLLNRLGGGAAR